MTTVRREGREPGLPSLNEARVQRRRAFVLGKVRMPGVPMHFWLWTAVGIGAFGVIYWRISQGELESARGRLMAKQRAMSVALGPKLFPFRDKVEGFTRELASAPSVVDFVSPNVDVERLRTQPSVYLRLRLERTKSVKELRKAVNASLRDGFTSCMFASTKARPDPTQGAACRTAGDCVSGLLCNEWNVCAEAEQPYNVRLVYRTLRVLSSEWTDEVHQATSELALAGYDRDLENVAKRDVPVTVQLVGRAKYFTLVLDEESKDGLPAEIPDAGESHEERLQRVPHFARVGIWDLASGEPLVRLRTEAHGEFVPMGTRAVTNAANLAAQQRQVNNCDLALRVRERLSGPAPSGTP
ncbi:MAG TPA: hypothetical protein VFQ61_07650 [Polyangiaceae bacterium]|nr:hypothetical protein [Polyangiaceae bacterium]